MILLKIHTYMYLNYNVDNQLVRLGGSEGGAVLNQYDLNKYF